jgi:hypothetical protein
LAVKVVIVSSGVSASGAGTLGTASSNTESPSSLPQLRCMTKTKIANIAMPRTGSKRLLRWTCMI